MWSLHLCSSISPPIQREKKGTRIGFAWTQQETHKRRRRERERERDNRCPGNGQHTHTHPVFPYIHFFLLSLGDRNALVRPRALTDTAFLEKKGEEGGRRKEEEISIFLFLFLARQNGVTLS